MKRIILSVTLLLLLSTISYAEVSLPKIIGSNMVLQRLADVNVWGWATPNSKITMRVSWNNDKYITTTNADGEWQFSLKTPDVRRGETITISDGDKITLSNICIGDVWICSGQSNMEMSLNNYAGQPIAGARQAALDASNQTNIRLFTVGKQSTLEVQKDCKDGSWCVSSAESASAFSAIGYFFGVTLSSSLNIPIGLINTSWGGSNIETWMSLEALENTKDIDLVAAKQGNDPNSKVAHLYNGMIAPISKFTARGFIWYQGESNRGRYKDYDKVMTSMVELWRKDWGDDKMPFYYVQIAPYDYANPTDITSGLLIESQCKALKSIPFSGMASTTDIGHPTCIHPASKREVAERLAIMALRNDYGVKGLPADAPAYDKMTKTEDGKIRLSFNNIGYGNTFQRYDNEGTIELEGFEMAGSDRVFHPAKADFINNCTEILVYSSNVVDPVAVRYAFRNSSKSNVRTIWNQPLIPFRTDSW